MGAAHTSQWEFVLREPSLGLLDMLLGEVMPPPLSTENLS
jgi:hypothetical protein